jgi:hypothetical protein
MTVVINGSAGPQAESTSTAARNSMPNIGVRILPSFESDACARLFSIPQRFTYISI